METLVDEIFGVQPQRDDALARDIAQAREVDEQNNTSGNQERDVAEEGEAERDGKGSDPECSPVLIPNLRQEAGPANRPEFMLYSHPNGFIQCWLLETNGFPWTDGENVNEPNLNGESIREL